MARFWTSNRRNPFALLAAVAFGAVVVLVVAGVFSWHPLQSAAAQRHEERATALAAPVGSCLTWQQPHERRINRTGCGHDHLFEIAGKVKLPHGDHPPSGKQLQRLSTQRCTKAASDYLDKPLDPHGKYTVGALAPDKQQWNDGEHKLVCGLRAAEPSGNSLRTVTGTVRTQDQSNVYGSGTCIGLTKTGAPGDPVACDKPHAFEIVGTVDLHDKLGNGYPSTRKQRHALVDRCTSTVKRYTQRDYGSFGLQLTWDTLGKRSWDAGSHRVDCKLAATDKSGSDLKATTGSVRSG